MRLTNRWSHVCCHRPFHYWLIPGITYIRFPRGLLPAEQESPKATQLVCYEIIAQDKGRFK